jgi:hypothetical protein
VRAVDDARDMLRAFPRDPEHTRNIWLQCCSRFYGMSASLAKKLWYREQKRIDADTYLRMRERHEALMRSAQRRQELLKDVDAVVGAVSRTMGDVARREGMARREPIRPDVEEARPSAAAAVRPGRR